MADLKGIGNVSVGDPRGGDRGDEGLREGGRLRHGHSCVGLRVEVDELVKDVEALEDEDA